MSRRRAVRPWGVPRGATARAGVRAVAGVALAAGALAVPAFATNDPHWDKQWAPNLVGAPAAWAYTTGAGVTIGIVDTGVDLAHEDLAGKVVAGTACIGTGGDPARCAPSLQAAQDVDGHGTHVAGIAVATRDNGKGIAGIAPDAKLAVARVFDGGSAELTDINAGIRWVVDHGARVVNLSLGEASLLGSLLGGGGSSLAEGVEYAWSRGAVAVLAAGNTNFFGLGSANYGAVNAVVVAATGRSDEPAGYSSPTGNAKWAVAAPGGNSAQGGTASEIFSTYWRPGRANEYAYLEGTSMAAPEVSATLALLLARGASNQRAVDALLATAKRGVGCGSGTLGCAGRLDVGAAVASLGGPPTTTASVSPATAPPTTGRPPTTRATTTTVAAAPTTQAPPPPTEPPATAAPPATEPPTSTPGPIRAVSQGTKDDNDAGVTAPGLVALALLVAAASAAAGLGRRWLRRG